MRKYGEWKLKVAIAWRIGGASNEFTLKWTKQTNLIVTKECFYNGSLISSLKSLSTLQSFFQVLVIN